MKADLLNCFADEILAPVFALDRVYADVTVTGGAAHVEGNRLVFDTDIPPYACVTLKLN